MAAIENESSSTNTTGTRLPAASTRGPAAASTSSRSASSSSISGQLACIRERFRPPPLACATACQRKRAETTCRRYPRAQEVNPAEDRQGDEAGKGEGEA